MRLLPTASRMMRSAQQPPPPQVWPESWHRVATNSRSLTAQSGSCTAASCGPSYTIARNSSHPPLQSPANTRLLGAPHWSNCVYSQLHKPTSAVWMLRAFATCALHPLQLRMMTLSLEPRPQVSSQLGPASSGHRGCCNVPLSGMHTSAWE